MENKIQRLQERLKCFGEIYRMMAEDLKEKDPTRSQKYFGDSEAFRTLAEEIVRMEPVKTELEIEGISWFWVCEECRAMVHQKDRYCRVCGRPLQWDGTTSGNTRG